MSMTPTEIQTLRRADPDSRARDFAEAHGIREAELVAAMGGVAIAPHPDGLMPLLEALGEVLALTRNASCVAETVGTYTDFRAGPHASMLTGPKIDMRIFPAHWVHGFAVTEGDKRSIQVFDAAGDAVHKVHLRPTSDVVAFEALASALVRPTAPLTFAPRVPVEGPRAEASRAQALCDGWDRMTDTHQFLKLAKTHRMNRLGAYRTVGAPRAVPMATMAVTGALEAAAATGVPVMIFVGNAGCIQIHGGPIVTVRSMGPWINVLDPGFDLHLRQDHVAEVWLVTKPTQRGPAISVEAFDAQGALIAQIFGHRAAEPGAWAALVAGLERAEVAA